MRDRRQPTYEQARNHDRCDIPVDSWPIILSQTPNRPSFVLVPTSSSTFCLFLGILIRVRSPPGFAQRRSGYPHVRSNATNFPVFFPKTREIEARDTFEQMETQRVFAASNGEEDGGFNDP